jgi:hypothetical protein
MWIRRDEDNHRRHLRGGDALQCPDHA